MSETLPPPYDDQGASDKSILWYEHRIKMFQREKPATSTRRDIIDGAVKALQRAQEAEVFDKPPHFDNFTELDRVGFWGYNPEA